MRIGGRDAGSWYPSGDNHNFRQNLTPLPQMVLSPPNKTRMTITDTVIKDIWILEDDPYPAWGELPAISSNHYDGKLIDSARNPKVPVLPVSIVTTSNPFYFTAYQPDEEANVIHQNKNFLVMPVQAGIQRNA